MLNPHVSTASSLMPSPLQASEPRNASEQEIKRLIQEALQSGKPDQYEDVDGFMRELRQDMHQRKTASQ